MRSQYAETASCIFQHFGRFGTPEVIHADRGTAIHNEVVAELLRMTGVEQSLKLPIQVRRMAS
jgi:hypothetical protein